MKNYKRLSDAEREEISRMLAQNCSASIFFPFYNRQHLRIAQPRGDRISLFCIWFFKSLGNGCGYFSFLKFFRTRDNIFFLEY